MNPGSFRCGWCEKCIDHELAVLADTEKLMWDTSQGDITRYLNYMGYYMDEFALNGLF